MNETTPHIPVLYKEVLECFSLVEKGTVIDCTMGYGGHSSLLLESNEKISLVGIDQDKTAREFCQKRLHRLGGRFSMVAGRFGEEMPQLLATRENIVGILADIGVSSLQLDERERGFSYESDTLDMRMDTTRELSAKEVLNGYSQQELQRIFFEYGELKNSRRLAEHIVKNRPFSSAKELVQSIMPLMAKNKKIHPATLLFQAVRIEVNDELGELRRLLDAIEQNPPKGARVAIISFHSLEDRIVKQRFAKWAKKCICPSEAIRCSCGANHALGKIVTKKPITASSEELDVNPRSRSAKLRVFEIAG